MRAAQKQIRIILRAALLVALAWSGAIPEAQADQASQLKQSLPLWSQLPYLAGASQLIAAEALGATDVQGKPLFQSSDPSSDICSESEENVPVSDRPDVIEDEPTVVANPKKKHRLVAGSHFASFAAPGDNRCVAYTSSDEGQSWSPPILLPQLTAVSRCSDPVLAYAPDGQRVYYAYMDLKDEQTPDTFTQAYDIVVSYSDDDGETWTGPILALEAEPTIITFNPFSIQEGFNYDKPWLGTSLEKSEKNWVYVTATRFDNFAPGNCHIAFTRSDKRGVPNSWKLPKVLDSSTNGCGNPVVVQGSRPEAGRGGDVLVAWYNSGLDGWLQGSFEIRTRLSREHGSSFEPTNVAASDSFETPFYLGPFSFYHRWWPSMFPDVEIDSSGAAHIAYTHDPDPDPASPEDGDIRYITSAGRPYTAWSTPVTINDDLLPRAQGFVALAVDPDDCSGLHAIWEDHRLSPPFPTQFPESPNLYYDIFSAHWTGSGSSAHWSHNFPVTDESSLSAFIFIGDYFDLTARKDRVYGVWTDRRTATSIFDDNNNVFGASIDH